MSEDKKTSSDDILKLVDDREEKIKIESANPNGPEAREIKNPDTRTGYGITWESHRQEFMILQVPLKEVADNPDTFQALCMLHGFFEQCKSEALNMIYKHKQLKSKNGILTPGLKVH